MRFLELFAAKRARLNALKCDRPEGLSQPMVRPVPAWP